MAEEYFNSYKLRLPQSARFAEYAIDHLKRILGTKMLVDFNEATVILYQNARLGEKASRRVSMRKSVFCFASSAIRAI